MISHILNMGWKVYTTEGTYNYYLEHNKIESKNCNLNYFT